MTAASAVGFDEVSVRVGRLGIFVEILHVRVGRRRVEVEVVFLHILAVVRLAIVEAEKSLFEDGILAVPQGQREAENLLVVRDAGQSIFSPAVGPRTRLVMAEIVPGIAIVTVILAYRTPLPLTQVGSPLLPWSLPVSSLFEPVLFSIHKVTSVSIKIC